MEEEKVQVPTYILERRNEIERRMVETGEMERGIFKKEVDQFWMERGSQGILQIEKGIERVTVQGLMHDLEVRGKHMIPIPIREDMLCRVRKYLEETEARNPSQMGQMNQPGQKSTSQLKKK